MTSIDHEQKPALFLMGTPGVGKTTVIKKTIKLRKLKFNGFYTQELQRNNQRYGFEIITLDGQQALLATKDKDIIFCRQREFEKYKVNIEAIESIAVPSFLKRIAPDTISVIDEVGPMEILSSKFCSAVMDILNNRNVAILGTIVQRQYEFADIVKRHPRVCIQKVNINNRDNLPQQIINILG